MVVLPVSSDSSGLFTDLINVVNINPELQITLASILSPSHHEEAYLILTIQNGND